MKIMTLPRTSASGLRYKLNKAFGISALVTAALIAMTPSPAAADDLVDVSKLMRAGNYTEALVKADAFLSQKPRDAQMRFLKGVILTEQNKSADAIAIFAKLTEDFPELPEPYNNLAVLYAAGGQFEKARAALDRAIRTNPTYATAYENLGDVHAKLASQAYDKALQLDSGNSIAKSKLTLVRNLVATSGGGTPKAPATATVAAAKPAASAPAVAAAATPAAAATAPSVPATVVATAKPDNPKAETKPAAKPDSTADRDAVMATVNGWANAWSAKDVKGYLAFYSSKFDTPNGMTRKAWAEERQARISGKGRINVKVESPQVSIEGNTATVKFRQIYTSDRLTANSRKTLVFARNGNKWQIQQERSGT
jgi:tetratricopeptide (TPR) repeat protein